jgi:hypothetical protein
MRRELLMTKHTVVMYIWAVVLYGLTIIDLIGRV